MQIQAYQFVKYDEHTTIEQIERVHDTGAVVCFDFEDGMINPLALEESATIKARARSVFFGLYAALLASGKHIKIGVRVNHHNTPHLEHDLLALAGKSFDAVFLPKTECTDDMNHFLKSFKDYKIGFKYLIPIVESKQGMENLQTILQASPMVRIVAFGHCDYNLDIGAYPFFHQDSLEYWKWINALKAGKGNADVQIINSPILDTGDEAFFCKILSYIANCGQQFYGQVTLTTRQSVLCNEIAISKGNFIKSLHNRHKIAVDKSVAWKLTEEFESSNKQKGLTRNKQKFISLQEYLASKKFLSDTRPVFEFCFVGGCFPVQNDIVYENLFHQLLKRNIEQTHDIKFSVNIIRYESFGTVTDKLKAFSSQKNPDLVVFHVRPEPYLRLVKLLYKYVDHQGVKHWSFNLPFLNILKSEKYDMLDAGRIYQVNNIQRKSILHHLLISFNYLAGCLIGNKHFALKKYLQTVHSILDYCNENDIYCLVLGPNRRNNNLLEPALCRELDQYFANNTAEQTYVRGYDTEIKIQMNQKYGIYATLDYQKFAATKLYKAIFAQYILPTSLCKSKQEGNS